MRATPKYVLPALCLVAVLLAAARAQEKEKQDKSSKPSPPQEKLSETKHTITVHGKPLSYTATAGTLVLKNDDGKALASVFFVAYTQPGAPAASRPVTFTFNGGPGSSAVWLHMGAFGPRRVPVGDVGERVAPPYSLVDNESTLLDVTDLVFIDPVSTGFSRPAPGQNPKQFHGVEEDVHSVGDFIQEYVTRFNRWDSPKFLAGESYGTTRAAALAGYLQDHDGITLSGVLLVSAVLNFQTLRFDDGNDLPFVLFLPSYTATAWYHKKLAPELQADFRKALDEAERFAQGAYNAALLKGDKLSADERGVVVRQLARLTGLSEEFVRRNNLRVDMARFAKELLRDRRRAVGRYDSRLVGADLDAASERPEYDPSYAAVQGTFTAALNRYLRDELNYRRDIPYEILTGKVQPWDFGAAKNRYLNVSRPLRQALTKNANLRVFVANGYYDLATPYFATEYTFSHLGLGPGLAGRVSMAYYDAGHMMYIDRAQHRKLKKDVAAFYEQTLRGAAP